MTAFALHTEGLTRRFGRVSAVQDLTFSVEPGEVFGFLGPTARASRRPSACRSA